MRASIDILVDTESVGIAEGGRGGQKAVYQQASLTVRVVGRTEERGSHPPMTVDQARTPPSTLPIFSGRT